MAKKLDLTKWNEVTMIGKVRKGKGRWYQFERSDGTKFIMTVVQQFVEEKVESKEKSAF